MGPAEGASEVLISRTGSTPMFAAMVNAAASHFAEPDDVHNGSVFHPAAVAGYEVGIRVGEFLGRSHYKIFHTTGTAGTVAAAAAVGRLLNLAPEQMQSSTPALATRACARSAPSCACGWTRKSMPPTPSAGRPG